MLVVTTENVVGHRVVELKGQCFGVVVRSRGLGGNVMAGLRSIVGGEIHEYTHLLEDARRQAVDRLVQNATVMGANAVLMMRFDSSEIGQTMSEIVAYGTAAVIEPSDALRVQLLRAALVVIGGVMLAAAAFGALSGCRLATVIPLAVWGAILAGGVLVERWRYQLLAEDRPSRDWQATPERFVDPETGQLVTVFFNPKTGERRYVADDNRRPAAQS